MGDRWLIYRICLFVHDLPTSGGMCRTKHAMVHGCFTSDTSYMEGMDTQYLSSISLMHICLRLP